MIAPSKARHVYFARCIGPVGVPAGAIKIGCSYGWEDRLEAVARNLPFTLELIAAVPGHFVTEAMCHIHLQKHRIAGEFFHENAFVSRFAELAAERGRAFYYVVDGGSELAHEKAVEAFMAYHGISLEAVCDYLGAPLARYEGKLNGVKNRRVIAATAILAQREQHFVNWPEDSLRHLIGEVHHSVKRLPAPQIAEAA